jgi:hypothetical protein
MRAHFVNVHCEKQTADRGRTPLNVLHPSSGIKTVKIGRAEVRKSGSERGSILHPLRAS